MTYKEARAYLAAAATYGIKLDLSRMRQLMHALGDPQKDLRFIHIAGTNGKGSTAAYCRSILSAAGHRVGCYISPYLERFTERISVIDGQAAFRRKQSHEAEGEIAPQAFARIMTRIRSVVDDILARGGEHPTEFELLTATAFVFFKEKACDLVVLETGLGGRLDATNVIENPLACVITALGYDHTERLGKTLDAIAGEKAGIIKPQSPAFVYDPLALAHDTAEKERALAVIQARCQALQAPLTRVLAQDYHLQDYSLDGQLFFDRVSGLTVTTSLLGLFQPMNALLAIRVCQALNLATKEQIQTGIQATRWPARMERVRQKPLILVDGAHNPQSCQALGDGLDRLLSGQPVVFLAGMLADKDVDGMLQAVLSKRRYRPEAFVCVAPDIHRALPADQLLERVRPIWRSLPDQAQSRYNEAVFAVETRPAGARKALALAQEKKACLCVFGSLYLVGEFRQIYGEQED